MESVTGEGPKVNLGHRVLNAFRHHGIGHDQRGDYGAGGYLVLNAFRHHGIGHTPELADMG